MKKAVVWAITLGCAGLAFAEPVEALLVVQNHSGDAFKYPLSSVSDRLCAALSGDVFAVNEAGDVYGFQSNVKPEGEPLPASSMTGFAQSSLSKVLITASVDNFSKVSVGTPAIVQYLAMTMTLQAKSSASGACVAGMTVTKKSRKFRPEELAANADAVYSDLVQSLCAELAGELTAKSKTKKWPWPAKAVEVGFGCNIPGADVKIDGLSVGTAGVPGAAPLKVRVFPGIHNVSVSFPFMVPYSVTARLDAATVFMVVLKENDLGRAQRMQDREFDLMMDRIAKSGATKDEVDLIVAKGYRKFFSASHSRIEGMPKEICFGMPPPPPPAERETLILNNTNNNNAD